MKNNITKRRNLSTSFSAKPETPKRECFLDTANDRVILEYFQEVRHQFFYANNFGMALDDSDLNAHGKPVLLDNLFVPPLLSESYFSPAAIASAEKKRNKPQLQEVYHLLRDKPQLFILGDPGAGKTTLIAWLTLAFSYSGENHIKGILGNLVPFPLILRDLNLQGVNSWDALLQVYLDYADGTMRKNQQTMRTLLQSGQALFMIDGVDEISEPSLRIGLGKALLDGMNRFSSCRFIFTSRLVGFSQVEFFNPSLPSNTDLGTIDLKGNKHRISHDHFADTPSFLLAHRKKIPIVYLAPFTITQVKRFITNWYSQYDPNTSLHAELVQDLMSSLGKNDALDHLCRIPVLLNMICFIHARRARLPDGRAELYGRIAETYLVAMDRARGLRFQGKELGADYHDLGHWLATLALQMQERRGTRNDKVLATRDEVETVFRRGLEEKGLSNEDARAQGAFLLDYIAHRTGFLIPRGIEQEQEVYAFSHLSFQEYFAARALGEELMFLKENQWKKLRANLSMSQWQEPFILLFELAPTTRQADYLAEQLFGKNLEQLQKKDDKFHPDWLINNSLHPGWLTLAHVAMDTAVRLGNKTRTMLIEQAWSQAWHVVEKNAHINSFSFPTIDPYDDVIETLWKDQFGSLELFKKVVAEHTTLRLAGRWLTNVSMLSKLTWLTTLVLSKTSVSNLTPLADLKQLRGLDLSNTKVGDIALLSSLEQLKVLDLGKTQVSDLSPLKNLKQLRGLDLSNTQVSDIHPLKNLKQLKALDLGNTHVSDLFPLKDLKKFTELLLYNTQVKDIAHLADMEKLEWLVLNNTMVNDLTPLKRQKKLKRLYMNDTLVSDLSPLKDLKKLSRLFINDTLVSDLNPLKELKDLEQLFMNNTQVTDLAPLKDLKKLRVLDLGNTQVSDLSPLKDLKKLEVLSLYNTQVNDISCLSDTVQIEGWDRKSLLSHRF